MRVLVIGGTGSFSTRVTQKALERGHDVLVYARGRRRLLDGLAARRLCADRSDLRAQSADLSRFAPDVVVDSICFDPARAEDRVALRYMLDAGLVRAAAEQPFDDALVERLARHEAELGELLARQAAAPR